jgi:hypothetical protein
MSYMPSTMPALDACLRRGLFRSHIYRRPVDIKLRGVSYVAAQNEQSYQRKATLSAFDDQTADLEIMLALPAGVAAPEANSTDEIEVFSRIVPGTVRTSKKYRITNVQSDIGPDCYQLTLSIRNYAT